jgi:hypothetical protein
MYKFCTVDAVKKRSNSPVEYLADDDLITACIEDATAMIRKYTRREWVIGDYTEYASSITVDRALNIGRNAFTLSLKEKPIDTSAAFSLKLMGSGRWDDAETQPASSYQLDASRGLVTVYPYKLTAHDRVLRIDYRGGYELDDTDASLVLGPDHVTGAAAIQAAFLYQRVKNRTSGVSQKQDRVGLSNFKVGANGLVMEAQALLRSEASPMVGTR